MPFVPLKLQVVAQLPVVRLTWAALAGFGCALPFLPLSPLLAQPGYEFSLALAMAHGLLASIIGAAALSAAQKAHSPRAPFIVAAAWVSVSALLPPLLISWLVSHFGTACDPFAQIEFFPVLTVPSSLLGVTAGALCRHFLSSARRAGAAFVALVLVSAFVTVLPILSGPQVFAFNHFAGFLPGPLYDEGLQVGPALLWFRVATLGWALFYFGVAGKRPRAAWAGFLVAVGIELSGERLGFRSSDAQVAKVLGASRDTEHFHLVFPKEKSATEVERWARDLEFRHHQLSAFLGGELPGKTTVWLYRSPDEKQRLTGAARTQFAKPWRREVHVNDGRAPQEIVKHELAHALAAPLGRAPFGVTARLGGLLPLAGLIEGFAVAADNPVDELTLHQWAAGMKRASLLPDVASLFSTTGFFAAAPSRAYTAAGSFIRYLGESRGAQKLRDLYADGNFERVYGEPLNALAASWLSFLDTQVIGEDEANLAFARFRKGSLFERACAREVVTLTQEASSRASSEPEAAAALYARCAALQPDEPHHVMSQAHALERAGKIDAARALLASWAPRSGPPPPSMRAELAMARADLEAAGEHWDEATALLNDVVAQHTSAATDRTARVKLAALSTPAVRSALLTYFRRGSDDVKLYLLGQALQAAPESAEVHYIVGRRLVQAGQARLGLEQLQKALSLRLPGSIEREARRLELEARYALGDCEGLAPSASEWHERCVFETKRFGSVLPVDEAGR